MHVTAHLVAFDEEIDVVLPAGPLADKPAGQAAIAGLYPRGGTNLSSGLLRGIQVARRAAAPGGTTEALLSTAGDTLAGLDDAERDVVLALASEIRAGFDRRAAKRALMQQAREARKRGRGADAPPGLP